MLLVFEIISIHAIFNIDDHVIAHNHIAILISPKCENKIVNKLIIFTDILLITFLNNDMYEGHPKNNESC